MSSKGSESGGGLGAAPVLALGFRPFFLVAMAFGAVAISWWVVLIARGQTMFTPSVTSAMWHAHEMIFGYLFAVIMGFLLTAVGNWTGLKMPSGAGLLGMVLLWASGRVAMAFYGALPWWLVALAVTSAPLSLWYVIGRRVVSAGSKRNYGILVILGLFTVLTLAAQLGMAGIGGWGFWPPLYGALHLAVMLNLVIGGRIIPMFTRNRTKVETRTAPVVDRVALVSALLTGVLVVVSSSVRGVEAVRYVLAAVALVAGCAHVARMRHWGVGAGLRVPMLAVLDLAYLGIVAGYFLLAVSTFVPAVNSVTSVHLFTVAGMGLMTVGMMTRVSLGHTGRPMEDDALIRAIYVTMGLAAVVRLLDYFGSPAFMRGCQVLSGVLVAVSLVLCLVWGVPRLTARRADGKPG